MVRDDQAIVVNVRNNGLVILTGCGHAGIINTIDYAKKVTGIDKVYAVFEGIIFQPMEELSRSNRTDSEGLAEHPLTIYVLCHCKGWKATNRIIETMTKKFLQSSLASITF